MGSRSCGPRDCTTKVAKTTTCDFITHLEEKTARLNMGCYSPLSKMEATEPCDQVRPIKPVAHKRKR